MQLFIISANCLKTKLFVCSCCLFSSRKHNPLFVDSTISSFGDHNYFIPGAGKKSGGEILLIFVWKYWVYLELLFKVSVVWDTSISVKCSEYVWGWITGMCVWNCADLFIVHKAKHNNNKKKPKIMTHRATSCSTKVKSSTAYYLTMIFLTDWQKIDLIFPVYLIKITWATLTEKPGKERTKSPVTWRPSSGSFSSPRVTYVLRKRCWSDILAHISSVSVVVCKNMIFPIHYLIQVQTNVHASKDRYYIFKCITCLTYLKWQGY